MFQLIFITVAALVATVIHFYLWRRLFRATTRPGRWRTAGGITVAALGVLLMATLIGTRVRPHWIAEPLAWPGYLWIALMFYLLVWLLVWEIPRVLVGRLLWRRRGAAEPARELAAVGATAPGGPDAPAPPGNGAPPADPTPVAGATPASPDRAAADEGRRLFLARSIAIVGGLTAAGTVGYGVRTALGPPTVDRVAITLAKLARGADRMRIAVVSDIHIGPLAGRAHTQRIVDIINSLDADLVTIVGDLVDGTVAELGKAAEPLRQLAKPSYFVTGNHEYYSGFAEWVEEVRALGVVPLRNQRVEITHRSGVIDLAGVNDVTGGQYADGPDMRRALDGRDPARPVVLMAHQPILVSEARRRGVDLQLSGHTHGGQMVPFNYLVQLQQPAVAGHARFGDTQLYVTKGAGFWGPPVRVGAPPDITLVELRAP